jgi:hypothetical protein
MTLQPREGRHRVADGAVADGAARTADAVVDPLLRSGGGRFTVQFLNDHWFIGEAGAAQRIEDAAWLDGWLVANGCSGHQDLDFSGDHQLKERFFTEFTSSS